ncbi:MAG: hypothetical protein H7Z73_05465 [Candidatus Saccharibacteria bacterium]|nr:hypothetical protein [Moraxellaceae bacterium]
MLRKSIQVVSFIALICSFVWLIYKPDYNSAFATFVALASFLSSFLLEKTPNKPSKKQSQKVSKGAIGIQAGGNVSNIRIKETAGDNDAK